MTISHQVITDKEGNPAAAVIPWEQFRVIQAEMQKDEDAPLDPEFKAELDRRMERVRTGESKTTPHDEVMRRAREKIKNIRPEKSAQA